MGACHGQTVTLVLTLLLSWTGSSSCRCIQLLALQPSTIFLSLHSVICFGARRVSLNYRGWGYRFVHQKCEGVHVTRFDLQTFSALVMM